MCCTIITHVHSAGVTGRATEPQLTATGASLRICRSNLVAKLIPTSLAAHAYENCSQRTNPKRGGFEPVFSKLMWPYHADSAFYFCWIACHNKRELEQGSQWAIQETQIALRPQPCNGHVLNIILIEIIFFSFFFLSFFQENTLRIS